MTPKTTYWIATFESTYMKGHVRKETAILKDEHPCERFVDMLLEAKKTRIVLGVSLVFYKGINETLYNSIMKAMEDGE